MSSDYLFGFSAGSPSPNKLLPIDAVDALGSGFLHPQRVYTYAETRRGTTPMHVMHPCTRYRAEAVCIKLCCCRGAQGPEKTELPFLSSWSLEWQELPQASYFKPQAPSISEKKKNKHSPTMA